MRNKMMKAMILDALHNLKEDDNPLKLVEYAIPRPGRGELLVRVEYCGVCHTEIDEIEGRTPPPVFPVIPGHQVVGRVVEMGGGNETKIGINDRVGVAWIFSACGICEYCRRGLENLCPEFLATGRDRHGGYAEYMVVPEAFAHPIPDGIDSVDAAPLLCAGAIGYRSLKLTGLENGKTLGLTGFGASAHLVMKMALELYPGSRVFVFARSKKERLFAVQGGAAWAGDTSDKPPEKVDAIIDTTPAWKPVVEALSVLKPAGRLVINAIRKETGDQGELQRLSYHEHLWEEKEVKSVANITRSDVREFLQIASELSIKPETTVYPLEDANVALMELKNGRIRGAKVLRVSGSDQ